MKRWGFQLGVGEDTFMTNLRFADDILLVGRSLHQIKYMIADVKHEAAKAGLELHPEKTKIQHNDIGYGSRVRSASIDGMQIEVLESSATTLYLGRALSLTDVHDAELKHRIRKGWAKFGIYHNELTDKSIPLQLRLKLFNSVVTPSILYGSVSWVMTDAREEELRSTQLKMARAMLGKKRRTVAQADSEAQTVESWVDWVRRVTPEAREAMRTHCVPDWVELQRDKLQRWDGRLQQMECHRWTRRVLDWQPEGRRSRGHPRMRWSDRLREEKQTR